MSLPETTTFHLSLPMRRTILYCLFPFLVIDCNDATGPAPNPGHLEVISEAALLPPGFETQLQVTAYDGAGRPLPGVNVEWSSSAPDIAGVSQDGVVAAKAGQGMVTISARSGGMTGQVSLSVSPLPGRLAVESFDPATYKSAIWIYGLDGSAPSRVGESGRSSDTHDRSPAWSRDGSRLAFICGDYLQWRICILSPDGKEGLIVAPVSPDPGFAPEWTPDGTQLLFSDMDGKLSTVRSDGTNLALFPVPGFYSPIGGARYSPDGAQLAFNSFADYYDTWELNVLRLDNGTSLTWSEGYDPAWSPNWAGRLAVASGRRLVLMSALNGGQRTVVFDGPGVVAHPAWSPDGQWIAFGRWDLPGEPESIWLIRPDGSNLVRLTGSGNGRGMRHPAWGR